MNFRKLEKVSARQTSHPRTNRKKMAKFTLSTPAICHRHQHFFQQHQCLKFARTNAFSAHRRFAIDTSDSFIDTSVSNSRAPKHFQRTNAFSAHQQFPTLSFSVRLSLSICVYLCVCMCVYFCVCMCVCVCVCIREHICTSYPTL